MKIGNKPEDFKNGNNDFLKDLKKRVKQMPKKSQAEIEQEEEKNQRKQFEIKKQKLETTGLPKRYWKINKNKIEYKLKPEEIVNNNYLIAEKSNSGKTFQIAYMILYALTKTKSIKYISDPDYFLNWRKYLENNLLKNYRNKSSVYRRLGCKNREK